MGSINTIKFKQNKTMRVGVVLALIALITLIGLTFTFAKYVSEGSGSDNARVAKWGLNIPIDNDLKLFSDAYKADGTPSTYGTTGNIVEAGTQNQRVIAPGTYNSVPVALVTDTAPEVMYDFNVELKIEDLTTKPGITQESLIQLLDNYPPWKWTLDGVEYKTFKQFRNAVNNLSQNDIPSNQLPSHTNIALGWKWDFDDSTKGTYDTSDTYMGDKAVNDALTQLKVSLNVDAAQCQGGHADMAWLSGTAEESSSNGGLADANVKFTTAKGSTQTKTDTNGDFRFQVHKGKGTLEISKVGYTTIKEEFTVENNKDLPAPIPVPLKELTGITITTPPTKTTYVVGDSFDKTGMVVTATYSDDSTKEVTDYACSPTTFNTPGTQDVTITYKEDGITKTTTQQVTVNNPKASVKTPPTALTTTPVYNGSPQTIANAGVADHGTMMYAVTGENTKPTDKTLFDATVPQKTNAGTYYLWYYAKGDTGYGDSDIDGSVVCTISKAESSMTFTLDKVAFTSEVSITDVSQKFSAATSASGTVTYAVDDRSSSNENNSNDENIFMQAVNAFNNAVNSILGNTENKDSSNTSTNFKINNGRDLTVNKLTCNANTLIDTYNLTLTATDPGDANHNGKTISVNTVTWEVKEDAKKSLTVDGHQYFPVAGDSLSSDITFYDADGNELAKTGDSGTKYVQSDLTGATQYTGEGHFKTLRSIETSWNNVFEIKGERSATIYPAEGTVKDSFVTVNLVDGNDEKEQVYSAPITEWKDLLPSNTPTYDGVSLTDIWSAHKDTEFGGSCGFFWSSCAYSSNFAFGWLSDGGAWSYYGRANPRNAFVMVCRAF